MKTTETKNGFKQLKTAVIIMLLSIFMIFILQNTQVVDIKFLFWQMSLSRVILLLGALLIGVLVGLFFGWEASQKRK
ncbi:MAG: hypothetical protein AMK71_05135 [Nitrospira bacterium SG8_35_4]|nr:MAG: hypothetical protein AMK71_05135 [Nitrospira bacterium SG8_35_4]